MTHRTVNHTRRRICRSHKGNPKPKQQRPLLLVAPVKEVQTATFVISQGLYSKAYINRLLAHTNYCMPKAFDAKDVQTFALKQIYD